MIEASDVSARIAKELDRLDADVVHVGMFDFSTMFRERRLQRADLLEATRRFRAGETAKRLFGASFVEHFATICEAEDAALRRAVSAAEVERDLEGG